jgi:hypothetical protein
MHARPTAAFLDFATLRPGVDTRALEALVAVRYHERSGAREVAARVCIDSRAHATDRRLCRFGAARRGQRSAMFTMFDLPIRELLAQADVLSLHC